MKKTKAINKKVLREILRRIVDSAKPEKIIVFGSTAQETGGLTAIWISW